MTTPNYDYHYLCTELRRKRMIPVITSDPRQDAGGIRRPRPPFRARNIIYVLNGRIEVHTEFYDPVVLEEGESIYIDSHMGHAYLAGRGLRRSD